MSIFALVVLFTFENKHWFEIISKSIQCKVWYLCDFLKMGYLDVFSATISCIVLVLQRKDLSIVISPKEIFESIRRNLHYISVAKLLHLSIYLTLSRSHLWLRYVD